MILLHHMRTNVKADYHLQNYGSKCSESCNISAIG